MSEINPFDQMLKDLESKTGKNAGGNQQKVWEEADLKKLFMAADVNHGTYYVLPVAEKGSNKPILMLDKVLDMKLYFGEYERTVRIAEKGCYSNLSDPQSKEAILYEEIQSMAKYLKDNEYNYKLLKYKDYTLMFGYVMAHYDNDANVKPGGYPALFIMNDKSIRETYKDELKKKMNLTGSLNFMGDYYNRNFEGRDKLLKLSYKRPQNYVTGMSYDKIDEDYLGITGGQRQVGFDPKFMDSSFGDLFDTLFKCTNKTFNYDYHVKVRDELKKVVEKFNKDLLAKQAEAPATPAVTSIADTTATYAQTTPPPAGIPMPGQPMGTTNESAPSGLPTPPGLGIGPLG